MTPEASGLKTSSAERLDPGALIILPVMSSPKGKKEFIWSFLRKIEKSLENINSKKIDAKPKEKTLN